jgi:hypothetical protein
MYPSKSTGFAILCQITDRHNATTALRAWLIGRRRCGRIRLPNQSGRLAAVLGDLPARRGRIFNNAGQVFSLTTVACQNAGQAFSLMTGACQAGKPDLLWRH